MYCVLCCAVLYVFSFVALRALLCCAVRYYYCAVALCSVLCGGVLCCADLQIQHVTETTVRRMVDSPTRRNVRDPQTETRTPRQWTAIRMLNHTAYAEDCKKHLQECVERIIVEHLFMRSRTIRALLTSRPLFELVALWASDGLVVAPWDPP